MVLNESMEMYLETIYVIEQDEGFARSVDIARRLKVSKPSVTKATNALKENGYINKETYGPITLTEKGKTYSKRLYGAHKLISSFLEDVLSLQPDVAKENACRMEHIITGDMLESIVRFMMNKGQCPVPEQTAKTNS